LAKASAGVNALAEAFLMGVDQISHWALAFNNTMVSQVVETGSKTG
jgi:hypothetical protein